MSARFRTFLSDCELERVELGIMTEEDKRGSLSRHHKGLEASQDDDIYPGGNWIILRLMNNWRPLSLSELSPYQI